MSSHTQRVDQRLYFGPAFVRMLEELDATTTIAQITKCCTNFSIEAGAEHFLYRAFLPATGLTVCFHNTDPEWVRVYIENKYCKIDPRTRYCVLNSDPIRWCDLTFSDEKNGPLAQAMMDHAKQYGFVDGISFPLHGVGSEASLFSLSTSSSLPDYSEMEIQTIITYATKVRSEVKRIQFKQNPKSVELPVLSEREKECLQWTANGKTSWEIGQILGVSESTVVFHISKAVNKLGVSNRVQAVAKAIAQSQFHLY